MDRFGTRLRDARLAAGMSQAEVAGTLLTSGQLALIESARVQPEQTLAEALAVRLNIPLDGAAQIPDPTAREGAALEGALRRGDWQGAAALLPADPTASLHRSFCAAVIRERQGDFVSALALLAPVVHGAETPSALRWRAIVAECRCNRYAGDLQRSITGAEAALAEMTASATVDAEVIAELKATLAGTYCETGDLVRALDLTEACDREHAESPWSIATQRWARSMVLQRMGRAPEAATLAFEALAILGTLDQPRTFARMQNNAAWLAMQTAGFDDLTVERLLHESEQAFREVAAHVDLAFVLTSRAEFAALSADEDTARACLTEAMEFASREDAGFRARITGAAAQIYASMGDTEASMTHLLTARTLLEESGARRSAAATWKQMAATYGALGHTDLQVACLRAAMDLLDLQ